MTCFHVLDYALFGSECDENKRRPQCFAFIAFGSSAMVTKHHAGFVWTVFELRTFPPQATPFTQRKVLDFPEPLFPFLNSPTRSVPNARGLGGAPNTLGRRPGGCSWRPGCCRAFAERSSPRRNGCRSWPSRHSRIEGDREGSGRLRSLPRSLFSHLYCRNSP